MKILKFWRLSPTELPSSVSIFDEPRLQDPVDLLARLSPRHGIILAHWNKEEQLGVVSALGIVMKVDSGAADVDWREVDLSLRPNPSGRTHWANKGYFAFAPKVVQRYGLADLFADRFVDLDEIEPSINDSEQMKSSSIGGTLAIPRRLPTAAVSGYVYVIRSPYGFKIGKTVNIRSRTRLFEVKLPFPISVEHYAWFDDYTYAEHNFHQMFREKRLEGEWFNLTTQDIELIKGFGKAIAYSDYSRA